ncbi:hypothetical protein ACEWY4_005881 [Coilia grayii]|uniref:MADF domain-containing protein n=1 Tax=Coilia grayii TaxID=363190 RepID=A0ABD1KJM6_9TELE
MEEKLVLAITGYPELYDFSHKNYQNKHLKQAAWSRVSFAVDRSVKECQKKWKYLRDESLKQRRMEKERRSGAEGGMRKRWKYMGILSFLEPYVKERETSSNLEFEEDSNTMTPELILSRTVSDIEVSILY